MLLEELFDQLELQYQKELPFVAYNKPNDTKIHTFFQKNNDLHISTNLSESGFVFAPFDDQNDTVVMRVEDCIQNVADLDISEGIKVAPSSDLENETSKKKHLDLVKKAVDAILEQKLRKVVLSRVEEVEVSDENPMTLFQSLLELYPSAFVYIWFHPKVGLWLGATPETLLKLHGLQFQTMALAGTQLFKSEETIKWDSKNKEEQEIVTNYIVSVLEPYTSKIAISTAKTIRAGALCHLQSEISGLLKAGRTKQVIQALHPTPAVCGMPKDISKEFILNNEFYDREFYTGFLGELNMHQIQSRNTNRRNIENNAYTSRRTVSDLFVNLRCMQLKKGKALVYVGGGITKDSIPEQEWEETVNKSQTIKKILACDFHL
ncbi:MAG: isochorismate synthase [Algicola sp.]|nr:isochorismate synthase [Algicola sp.]